MSEGYKRVLIKLSGEALAGEESVLSGEMLTTVARTIAKLVRRGIGVAVVIGAGNIWRGARQKRRPRSRRPYGDARHNDKLHCNAGLYFKNRRRRARYERRTDTAVLRTLRAV